MVKTRICIQSDWRGGEGMGEKGGGGGWGRVWEERRGREKYVNVILGTEQLV